MPCGVIFTEGPGNHHRKVETECSQHGILFAFLSICNPRNSRAQPVVVAQQEIKQDQVALKGMGHQRM